MTRISMVTALFLTIFFAKNFITNTHNLTLSDFDAGKGSKCYCYGIGLAAVVDLCAASSASLSPHIGRQLPPGQFQLRQVNSDSNIAYSLTGFTPGAAYPYSKL
ncbi:hypothetical protein DdX_13245 [Ditylenchus destructor]|uniref:Uncharacterized protein n=1 Tax=Ditylenchus destructor TaxID=166010 RepID=A0AAD4QZN4_9BILA|nr:hypothetical protein DdX_13245 [Ditylenchus destructor]